MYISSKISSGKRSMFIPYIVIQLALDKTLISDGHFDSSDDPNENSCKLLDMFLRISSLNATIGFPWIYNSKIFVNFPNAVGK